MGNKASSDATNAKDKSLSNTKEEHDKLRKELVNKLIVSSSLPFGAKTFSNDRVQSLEKVINERKIHLAEPTTKSTLNSVHATSNGPSQASPVASPPNTLASSSNIPSSVASNSNVNLPLNSTSSNTANTKSQILNSVSTTPITSNTLIKVVNEPSSSIASNLNDTKANIPFNLENSKVSGTTTVPASIPNNKNNLSSTLSLAQPTHINPITTVNQKTSITIENLVLVLPKPIMFIPFRPLPDPSLFIPMKPTLPIPLNFVPHKPVSFSI